MNIKNTKDLFLIFAAVAVLFVMFPKAYPEMRDKLLYAADKWDSGSGVWLMPEIGFPEALSGFQKPVQEPALPDLPTVPAAGDGASQTTAPTLQPETEAPVTESSDTGLPVTEPADVTTTLYTEPPAPGPVFVHSDKSYFDNALFIGDSRTEDLGAFGGLDNADFYARVGMSVFNLDDKDINVKGYGKVRLDALLSAKGYGKVYIMLGYNEIGYNFKSIIKKYKELIDRVRTAEPSAIIYLEANLLVSEEYSRKKNDADNPSLIELNRRISELADNETIFYIDVNPVFCENGALKAELSGDGTHPYAKYYKTWAEWLCDNTVDMSSIRKTEPGEN